jgi:chemotaxis protein histidine kinase CheA
MGGRVDIQTSSGEGTQITLRVPMKKAALEAGN